MLDDITIINYKLFKMHSNEEMITSNDFLNLHRDYNKSISRKEISEHVRQTKNLEVMGVQSSKCIECFHSRDLQPY